MIENSFKKIHKNKKITARPNFTIVLLTVSNSASDEKLLSKMKPKWEKKSNSDLNQRDIKSWNEIILLRFLFLFRSTIISFLPIKMIWKKICNLGIGETQPNSKLDRNLNIEVLGYKSVDFYFIGQEANPVANLSIQ